MTKGTGKKKIDIKKIANNSARNVTFSKRRTGLFKKAQELERISGARVAILVFSPSGRLYTSGDVSLFDNNLSTEIASNSYAEPTTLRLKNFNVESCNEISLPARGFDSSGDEFSVVNDFLENNEFTSKSHLFTETASNSYSEPSTLRLKNFNVEGYTEIFSPDGPFNSTGEFSIVDDDLENNGFTSKSHLFTETASNSYSEPSALLLKNFNEFFSPAGQFYSSGKLPIVDEDLMNHGFCLKSDLCTDFGSNLYENCSTLWMGNLNVKECSVDDYIIEEERDKFVLKMELKFIEESLMV